MKAGRGTPAERGAARHADTERDLRAALARLQAGAPTHPDFHGRPVRISPATVCREAGHSRNALYENHKEVLAEIRKARPIPPPQPAGKQDPLRDELEELRAARQQLISENAALLYRLQIAEKGRAKAEARLAEMERQKPVPLRRPLDNQH